MGSVCQNTENISQQISFTECRHVQQIIPKYSSNTAKQLKGQLIPQQNQDKVQSDSLSNELFLTQNDQQLNQDNQNYINISNDTRVRVDKQKYPYSAIGILKFDIKGQTEYGTGFRISKNIVLSCAHNYYDTIFKQKANKITFNNMLRQSVVKNIYIPPQYFIEYHSKYDYAFLQLEQSCQDSYLGTDFSGMNKNKMGKIVGYPQYIYQKKQRLSAQNHLYEADGQLCYKQGLIKHQIPASKGQDGSPIFSIKSGKYHAFGIHIQKNEGIILNQDILTRLNKWISQNQNQNLFCDRKNLDSSQINIIDNFQEIKDLQQKQRDQIKTLRLFSNQIGNQGLHYLSERSWNSLKVLNLGHNRITDKGIKYLLSPIFNDLTELFLAENLLTDLGVQTLVMKQWDSLQLLSLTSNKIGDHGAKCIKYKDFPKIKWLYMGNNQLTNQGLVHLIHQQWSEMILISLINTKDMSKYPKLLLFSHQNIYNKNKIRIDIKI